MLAQGPIVNAAKRLLPSCCHVPCCASGDLLLAIHPLIVISPSSQLPQDGFSNPGTEKFRGSDKESSSETTPERRSNVALMRR
jgi:hypothetical protein